MLIESGLIVAIGLLLTFLKCSWSSRMWILSHQLLMDIIIFALLNILHWGTFSGVMVAAIGAGICSGCITLGRWLVGHQDRDGYYIRGCYNALPRINQEIETYNQRLLNNSE